LENILDTQEYVFYTAKNKKEVLINYQSIQFNSILKKEQDTKEMSSNAECGSGRFREAKAWNEVVRRQGSSYAIR
jgi:hypothetical protein